MCGRHHHHAIIQHTEGLTRDVLEELWSVNGKRIGLTRGEYLDVDHGSVEGLVRYIGKNKRCARSWRQSRGLEKPKTPPPNDSKWSRKKFEEAATLYIDDAAFWERQYPGYTLNRVETSVSNSGHRHTVVILRRAECWHGRGNVKENETEEASMTSKERFVEIFRSQVTRPGSGGAAGVAGDHGFFRGAGRSEAPRGLSRRAGGSQPERVRPAADRPGRHELILTQLAGSECIYHDGGRLCNTDR